MLLLLLLLPLHYSPLWALACRRTSFHFSLSATNSLHLLTPSTWRSLSTSSFHLFLDLPLLLVPSSSWAKIFLGTLSFSILSISGMQEKNSNMKGLSIYEQIAIRILIQLYLGMSLSGIPSDTACTPYTYKSQGIISHTHTHTHTHTHIHTHTHTHSWKHLSVFINSKFSSLFDARILLKVNEAIIMTR